jgi:hypothetical protein
MAETPSMPNTPNTSSTQKGTIKPEPYAPSARSSPPEAERVDQATAAKTGRAAAPRADQPVTTGPKLKAVTITIDTDSADIVRVEGLDAKGGRHELTDDEKASFIKEGRSDERLEEVLEHAFEAGIACVLGDDEDEDEETTQESPADAELRHQLLAPLIRRSAVRQLTDRAALHRAILGTLIEHSGAQSSSAP